jgi:hypothetical protein
MLPGDTAWDARFGGNQATSEKEKQQEKAIENFKQGVQVNIITNACYSGKLC